MGRVAILAVLRCPSLPFLQISIRFGLSFTILPQLFVNFAVVLLRTFRAAPCIKYFSRITSPTTTEHHLFAIAS